MIGAVLAMCKVVVFLSPCGFESAHQVAHDCHVLQEAMTEPSPHDGHMRFASPKPLHSNVVSVPYMGHVHHISAAMRANVLAVSARASTSTRHSMRAPTVSRPMSLMCPKLVRPRLDQKASGASLAAWNRERWPAPPLRIFSRNVALCGRCGRSHDRMWHAFLALQVASEKDLEAVMAIDHFRGVVLRKQLTAVRAAAMHPSTTRLAHLLRQARRSHVPCSCIWLHVGVAPLPSPCPHMLRGAPSP